MNQKLGSPYGLTKQPGEKSRLHFKGFKCEIPSIVIVLTTHYKFATSNLCL